eukprot:gene12029-14214_t
MDSVLSLNFQDAREPGSIRELPGRILRKANVDRYIQYLGQWSTKDASKINSILSIARAEVEKGKERFGKVMKFSGGPGKSDLAVNDKEIAIVTTAAPPWLTAFLLERVNQICCKAYCDRVVKLSPAVQQLPRQSVCNINGVGAKFLRIGDQKAAASRPRRSAFKKGCYYLAKMQWGKGYTELLDLMAQDAIGGGGISVDAYGSGDDSVAIVAKAQEEKLSIQFNGHQEGQGRYEHTDTALQEYKVFLNPSISDVLATTTAEALAMGKFVVAPDHACNTFFQDFPNFLSYKDAEGFRAQVQKALHAEPAPLSPELRHRLTWEAATDRFLVEVTRGAPEQSRLLPGLQEEQGKPFESTRGHVDGLIANVHHAIATVPGARAVA